VLKPKVVVEINEDGTDFTVDVQGMQGPTCKRVQKDFEGMGKRVSEKTKAEYNQLQGTVNAYARR
jgi:hypothetical protein